MKNQTNQTWTLLREGGIVQGEQPEKGILGSPWYVKMLVAFSGGLAAVFIIGFIIIGFVFIGGVKTGIVGMIMIAGAFALLRIPTNDFVEHLGLAISIAGQAFVAYSLFEELYGYNAIMAWLLLAIFQALLVVFIPNFIHCVFSTLAAAMAFSMALNAMGISYAIGGVIMFGASLCWLNEFRFPHRIKKIRAMGYGLSLTLIGSQTYYYDLSYNLLRPEGLLYQPWLDESIIGAVTLYVVWCLLQRYGQPIKGRLAITTLLATLIVCAVSINVQGITAGMVVICLGFLGANRVLLGLGIMSLLSSIFSYYYSLYATLLYKSQSLLVVGLILLFIRLVLLRYHPRTQ